MVHKRKKPEADPRNLFGGAEAALDDVVEGPGFWMGRMGRHIFQEVNRTPGEQQELIDLLRASIPGLEESIVENTKAIEEILTEYDPIDLISRLVLATATLPTTDADAIYDPDIPSAFAEHVTLLACKRPYQQGLPTAGHEKFKQLVDCLNKIFADILWLKIGSAPERSDNPEEAELQQLAFLTYMHELKVRGRAYHWHYQELITALFEPYQRIITESLGFGVADPGKVAEALQDALQRNLYERMSEAKEFELCLLQAIDAYENSRQLPTDYQAGTKILEHFSKVPKNGRASLVRCMTFDWVFSAIGHCATSTVATVSEFSGLDYSVVESVLERLSITFNSVNDDYTLPETVTQLSRTPFLKEGNRYLLPSPCLVQPSVVGLLESCLKGAGNKKWAQYDKHRHQTVLNMTMNAMGSMMCGSKGLTELYYETYEHEQTKQCEIDGVILYGTMLFLLEVKGASLSDPARRGGEKRLDRDVGNLVGEAHQQALRAKRFITSAEQVVFRNSKGHEQLVLRHGEVTSIYMITVTLEPAGFITATINSRTALSAFEGGLDEFPWMVSIFDLLAIAEVIDEQFVFPHYVKSRVRFAKKTLAAGTDELDFLGHYFLDGLQILAENLHMMMLAATHDIDNYLYRMHGISRPPSKKPRPAVAPGMRELLRKLARSTSPFRVEVAMALLDIPRDRQPEFLNRCEKCLKRAKRRGKPQGFSEHVKSDGGLGITFMVDPARNESRFEQYCEREKNKLNARIWIGLLRSTKRGDLFHLIVYGQDLCSA